MISACRQGQVLSLKFGVLFIVLYFFSFNCFFFFNSPTPEDGQRTKRKNLKQRLRLDYECRTVEVLTTGLSFVPFAFSLLS